jgi:cold shock CspA family protein
MHRDTRAVRFSDGIDTNTARRHRGLVTFFNYARAFGFIHPDDADDVGDCFFGSFALKDSGLTVDNIHIGDVVEFDLRPPKDNDSRPSAINITIVRE